MKLTEKALNNPAFVLMGIVMIILVGLVTFVKLPVQLFPEIERPVISIRTEWRAASPQEIESEILQPQEQVLKGIAGLANMTAFANRGNTFINLEFTIGTNMEQALIAVISRMTRLPSLPNDATSPQVRLGGFGGGTPALTFFFLQALPGNEHQISEYFEYANTTIAPRLESIQGVSGIELFNDRFRKELQIKFDPIKAVEYGVSIPQLINAVSASNDISGGTVDVGKRQYTLRFNGKYQVEELEQLILVTRSGSNIRLGDIATIGIGNSPVRQLAFQNGNPAFSMRINRANGANLLATMDRVKNEVSVINKELLLDKKLVMVQSFDASVFIKRAVGLVTNNLFIGAMLSLFILWFFIRRSNATLIIATAIPISLLSTFIVLHVFGRSLNVISLAGLAFAVGMVLDAAIVVLENILRLREKGKNRVDASLLGATQVWGALLASTATTVAIFLPVFFLQGVEGQLFGDLALTIAIAVSVSLIVAVVLLPVLARYYIANNVISDPHQQLWMRISNGVMKMICTVKRRFMVAFILMAAPIIISWYYMPSLDYLPPVKRDAVDAFLNFPSGANIETIKKEVVEPIIERLQPYMDGEKEPALKNYYIFAGSDGGNMGIRAKDQSQVNELLEVVKNEILIDLPDTNVFASQGNLFGGFNGSRSVSVRLQSKNYQALLETARSGVKWIESAIPNTTVRPRPNLEMAEPELQLNPNDRRILENNWNRRDVGMVVRTIGQGMYVGEHFDGTNRMNIILRASGWEDPEKLGDVPIVTGNGGMTQLNQLVDINRSVGPSNLTRINGYRTVTLNVNPPESWSLEKTISTLKNEVEPKLKSMLPSDGSITYGGSASQLTKAIDVMGENFLVALIILFLLMAALFKSAKDSLLVLISIPLATFGGVLALQILNLFTFQSLDLLTMIGFVILLGLVVNNAILLVHQTRQAQASGSKRSDAIKQSLRLRLRPIFMSTFTSFFGMLPLLLMPGAGSAIYRGLAAVIVGGLSVSTIFTIILLPCLLQFRTKDFGILSDTKDNKTLKQIPNNLFPKEEN
jgi:multidrug efflux pump subunit AcrB